MNLFKNSIRQYSKTFTVAGLASIGISHGAYASTAGGSLELAWQTAKIFKTPESVAYDKRTGLLFVSNIDGAPNEKDGNGFISVLDNNGKMVQLKWVEGLSAPKGLAIVGNKLYVSDIDELVEIDIDRGKVLNRFQGQDAKFLNDVAADDKGNIYVSDMVANVIYRLKDNAFKKWVSGEGLENPNGLLVKEDQLLVASWGKMVDGFKTDVPGHMKTISLDDKTVNSLGDGSPTGNLDGLTFNGKNGFFVTDWMSGGLFEITAEGQAAKVLNLPQGSADHEYIEGKQLILIPMMMEGKVLAYKVKS